MKRLTFWFIIAAILIFVLPAPSPAQGTEVIKLRAANYLPVTHPMSLLTAWFCDEVKKRSKGRVEIAYHPAGTLVSPVKMFDGVVTGITDLGFSHIQYNRGKFPVFEVFDLPLGFPSGWVSTQVATEFYEKFKPKEWDDVHILYLTPSAPLILQLLNKPVRTLEDLKGLKIRATGQLADIIKLLGGVPVPLPMPDVYEALRRGVIDGVSVSVSSLKHWKFGEVTKFVTPYWQLGTTITFYFVMNKRKWAALPADLQKIFTEVAAETREKQAVLWDEMDVEGRDFFTSLGGQITHLSDAEAARWIKAVEPIIADYKKTMVAKGHKEAEVDGWIKFIRDRNDYWLKEQKRRGLPFVF